MATLVIDHAAASGHADQHPHEHGPAPVSTGPSPERVAMPAVSVNGTYTWVSVRFASQTVLLAWLASGNRVRITTTATK